jgi:hypothetical protein
MERVLTPRVMFVFHLLFLALLLISAARFQFSAAFGQQQAMTDFHAFYVAGLMYWDNNLPGAYHFRTLYEAQQRFTGTTSFMPWTYPPPFNLVTALLASLPIGLAYLMFTGGTLVAYLAVLRRIAGAHAGLVTFAILPAILLNIRTGQNGFMTGALIGTFLLAYVRGSAGGGVALGLMVFKPHLAAGSAILALLDGRWGRVFAAAATVLALLAASTWVFGIGIWPAFGGAVREASQFMEAGYYPFFRMTSVYALLHSWGAPPAAALVVQVALLAGASAVIVAAALRLPDRRLVAAIVAFCSLLFSPYNYDYDATLLGLAIAFLMPVMAERMPERTVWKFLGASWIATGSGFVMTLLGEATGSGTPVTLGADDAAPSLGFLGLALVAMMVWRHLPRLSSCASGRS